MIRINKIENLRNLLAWNPEYKCPDDIPKIKDSSVKFHLFDGESLDDERGHVDCYLCCEPLSNISGHDFMQSWFDTNLGPMCFDCFNHYVDIVESFRVWEIKKIKNKDESK